VKGKRERGKPSAISVDKDGKWYFEGREIIRKDILALFYEHLHQNEDGYYVEVEGDREYLEVEDTVFLVESVSLVENGEEAFLVYLNDGTEERLDLETLRITESNVPYCMVKGGRFSARFLRLPFYQLGKHAEYDEEAQEYFLLLNGEKFPLRIAS
jgi:hypothetical protein